MRGHNCAVHKHRMLVPIEMHHIWPLGYHGPDIPANKIAICANAHSDVHYLMEDMLKRHPHNFAEYGPGVRALAIRGYNEVMTYGEELSKSVELRNRQA